MGSAACVAWQQLLQRPHGLQGPPTALLSLSNGPRWTVVLGLQNKTTAKPLPAALPACGSPLTEVSRLRGRAVQGLGELTAPGKALNPVNLEAIVCQL